MCSAYGKKRKAQRVFVGKPKGRDHLEDLGLHGKIIIKWLVKQQDIGSCSGLVSGRRQCSQYSDALPPELSGNRIPLGA